jgi:putative membrane protein
MSALFAFLHHVLAFLLVSTLVVEMALLKGPLTQTTARQLARTDLLYGIAAGLVVVVGFLRVYHFEKAMSSLTVESDFRGPRPRPSSWRG